MRSLIASLVLWGFGFFLLLNACALGVLLFRAAREAYWRGRYRRAVRRKYPAETQPLIHLIQRSTKEP